MCGFILNTFKKQNFQSFKEFTKLIEPRGPDYKKILRVKNLQLAHCRLKIIDTNKRSNQPFHDKEKRYYLLYNGEIYNFLNLKKKFSLQCKTKSDTEVLFLLLKRFGIKKTLIELEGMFSFVFVDTKLNKIFCARDHFGQKPFYYYNGKKGFVCSTSIKPIVKMTDSFNFDKKNLYKYLSSSGILETDQTIFKNIKSLPAGHYLIYKNKNIKIQRYFHPSDLFDFKLYENLKKNSLKEIIEKLAFNIKNSIGKHLISDVPVGICLSGGIDSSLITHYALEKNRKVKIFSGFSKKIEKISFKVIPKLIKNFKTKKLFKVNHSYKDYLNDLKKLLIFSYSPSRWGGGVPMSKICKSAKYKKVSVLLGGDGVDEISGGYHTINNILNKQDFKNFHSIISLDKKNIFYKNKNNLDFKNYLENEKKYILTKLKKIKDKSEKFKQLTFLLDTSFFLQTCTLPHSDEYSMFRSVELRNPYLDLKLVKFVINLKGDLKTQKVKKNFNNKFIFKELAKKIFGKFIDQPKEGTRNFSKMISNVKFWNLGNFKVSKFLRELKKENIEKKLDYKTIFKLISLEIIYRDIKNIRYSFFKNDITKEEIKYLL